MVFRGPWLRESGAESTAAPAPYPPESLVPCRLGAHASISARSLGQSGAPGQSERRGPGVSGVSISDGDREADRAIFGPTLAPPPSPPEDRAGNPEPTGLARSFLPGPSPGSFLPRALPRLVPPSCGFRPVPLPFTSRFATASPRGASVPVCPRVSLPCPRDCSPVPFSYWDPVPLVPPHTLFVELVPRLCAPVVPSSGPLHSPVPCRSLCGVLLIVSPFSSHECPLVLPARSPRSFHVRTVSPSSARSFSFPVPDVCRVSRLSPGPLFPACPRCLFPWISCP